MIPKLFSVAIKIMLFWCVTVFLKDSTNFFIRGTKMAGGKKLPTKAYVLGHEYEIQEMSQSLFKEREAYGDCCNEQKRIRVYCGTTESVIRDTLLHEVLHAAWCLLYIQQSEEEEKIVSRLATLLIGFFDDPRNLKVKNFILGKGKEAAHDK
tara:strand:+ start:184 stop:639 length:456 start_codon:yes stop_codon:yes gene_type:complete